MTSTLARLRIVAFNDVYELANLPRLQTFLSQLEVKPSAVVLAGDFLSPSTLSSIDGGRGMVATLRALGLTHISLGNHEQDLRLESLRSRLEDLSKSVEVVNTNMRQGAPPTARWITSVSKPYSIVQSSCERVRVALLGLMTDEQGVFRDKTFKGIPIGDVLETYEQSVAELIPEKADFVLPMTHESLYRDEELARHMLKLQPQSSNIIIGGHEHEPYDVSVAGDNGAAVRILKSGTEANAAGLIDLSFDTSGQKDSPQLVQVDYDLVETSNFEPSIVVQNIVDKHMSAVKSLEDEYIIDEDSTNLLSPGTKLSSERTRFQQTTVGAVFCQMIKEELEVDVAIVNGATIKGDATYANGRLTYAELKKEFPFPTKMVVVPMERWRLQEAISYSRTHVEDGLSSNVAEVPRRGFLQVDCEFEQTEYLGYLEDILKVALPRNLLNGFCKIEPLVELGTRLKEQGLFPAKDDYVPAIDLVVRHACKNRWLHIASDFGSFEEYDLNHDGILDRDEIKAILENFLGHSPHDFVVDDMIASIDMDENGSIDRGEFSFLLASMEREHKRF